MRTAISLRVLLSLIIMLAGVLLGMGLNSPAAYAAPEIEAPQVATIKQLPVLNEKPEFERSDFCQRLYDKYIYEPLILRPQIERTKRQVEELIIEYNANYSEIERLTPEEREQVIDAIFASSKEYNLDPLLVAAVTAAESSFRIRNRRGQILKSSCGAIGIMQIMPIHSWKNDLTTIEGNIDVGCWYLRVNMDKFIAPEVTLAAYNAGPGRAAWALHNIPETRSYVKKTMRIYAGLKGAG